MQFHANIKYIIKEKNTKVIFKLHLHKVMVFEIHVHGQKDDIGREIHRSPKTLQKLDTLANQH